MTPDSPAVSVIHSAVPGRARLRVTGLSRSPRLKFTLESGLAGKNSIRCLSANVWTGNVLVFYDPQEDLNHVLACILEELGRAETSGDAPSDPAAASFGTAVGTGLFSFVKDVARWLNGATSGAPRSPRTALRPHATPDSIARPWHTLDARQVAQFWETSPGDGLPSALARQRLEAYGPNALPSYEGRSPLAIFADQFKSLPVLLLLGSAVLSVFTGGVGDAVVITLVVVLNASVGFATEAQAERTIATLLEFEEPVVTAIRDGAVVEIRGDGIVPGDIMVLSRGCPVVADARILQANWLSVDESVLTGESMPVDKSVPAIPDEEAPIAQRSNMVFRGTMVTGGNGLALVIATGQSTEIGNVQRLIAQALRPETPLERQLGRLSNQMVWATGLVAGGVLLVGLLRGFSFLQMINSAISLAVAAVPEGLPVVATTALANTVHEMLQYNVLVRRLDAIEALGSTEVVCLDKTGTLTLNRMTVSRVFSGMQRYLADGDGLANSIAEQPPGSELMRLMEICTLCNDAEIDAANGGLKGTPTEAALLEMALKAGTDVRALRTRHPRLKTEQRGEHRNYMSTWHDAGEGRTLVAVKGSPHEVLALCRFYAEDGIVSRLGKRHRDTIAAENERMAGSALRVLGVAYLEMERDADPPEPSLTWLGLVGMADPPREGLREFIHTLRDAGIRPLMLTGDQTATAQAVGHTLEMETESELRVMDAAVLERLQGEELHEAAANVEIFSRVNPTDKLKIVQALQKDGTVVAMTGDGINDGPALRAADIGITLGKSGTQVAQEVSDVVLRDDNIHSLIPAIRDGRRIHENIRRAIHYISATNSSEVLLMFLSLAAGIGQPLTARQLLWINVLTDVFPELALATQAAESDVMRRPPADPNAPVIGGRDVPRLARQCGIITAAALGCYGYGIARYGIGPQASSVAFLGLAGAQLLHAFSARSDVHTIFERDALPPNRFLTGSVLGATGGLIAAQFVPGLRTLLGTAPIGLFDFLVCGAAACGSLLLNEMWKSAATLRTPQALPAPRPAVLLPAAEAA